MSTPCPYKYQFHPNESTVHIVQAFSLFTQQAYIKLQDRWLGVNKELTESLEKIHQLSTYFNHIVKNIAQGVLWIHLDGKICFINPLARLFLGIEEESVFFKKIEQVLPQEGLGFSIKEALAFGLAPKTIYKTLNQRVLEISTFFIYEGPRARHGLLVLIKDISEIDKLRLTMQRREKLHQLGEMVARVAHEIRNPLGGMRGYASLLFRDLRDFSHLQEMSQFIIDGTKRLETLVTSVLEYARPLKIQIRPVELGQFSKQWAKNLKMDPAFPDTVELKLYTPFSSFVVCIDPEAIKSALLNLAFNGIQAMPTGGTLSVAILQRDASCQIEIADTGIGMEEEELNQLFSPFYTTKQKGTGLGLVEVQKIVQAHLGSIEVRSKPHRGSTFTITLPLKR